MTLQLHNVLIVCEDLGAVQAFFAEIGLEVEDETRVEGPWADRVLGLEGVRADITMMRTPDGHGRVELSRFHAPPAVDAGQGAAPTNALGLRRIMFLVEGLDDLVARLEQVGGSLVDEIARYEDMFRLCFVRGPEGIVVGLSERLSS